MPTIAPSFTARRAGSVLVLALGCISLAACVSSRKAPPDLPPPPGPPPVAYGPPPGSQFQGPVPGSQGDFLATMMGQDTIHFSLDKSSIDPAAAAALQAQAQWLMRYPNKHATIEGHCDERGTREYNLALGQRRANAAKDYLVSLGIAPARLSTVSYGKERPVDPASNEEAWAKNRRAVTVVID